MTPKCDMAEGMASVPAPMTATCQSGTDISSSPNEHTGVKEIDVAAHHGCPTPTRLRAADTPLSVAKYQHHDISSDVTEKSTY